MELQHLIAFNLVLLAAIASPGPAMLVSVRTALVSGRSAGIAVGLGLGTMAALWTLTALLGLTVVFEIFPWAYTVAKIAGALYLLYIAWKMWTGARQPVALDPDATKRAARDGFVRGLLINLLNPKSVIFAAAVLVVVFPPSLSALEVTVIFLNHLIVELAFYTALAVAMSTTAVSKRYLAAKLYIDRAASVVLSGLGIKLLLDRS